jgi:hypothetical protein
MTVGEWLRSRSPRPPDALSARLDAVLAESLGESAVRVPDLFLAAGERLVAELLRSDSTSRDSALDLLTADALLTYAFEAAGGDVATIEARASEAMTRIAALGDATLAHA